MESESLMVMESASDVSVWAPEAGGADGSLRLRCNKSGAEIVVIAAQGGGCACLEGFT